MFIEALRRLIFSVHKHCEYAQFNTSGPKDCIGQQNAPKSLSLVIAIHSEPAEQYCGYDRIPRQLFDYVGRERVQRNTRRCQRIKASDITGLNAYGHKAGGDSALCVLRRMFPKVPVQAVRNARKGGPFVVAR
jgi:hypothetical protein